MNHGNYMIHDKVVLPLWFLLCLPKLLLLLQRGGRWNAFASVEIKRCTIAQPYRTLRVVMAQSLSTYNSGGYHTFTSN